MEKWNNIEKKMVDRYLNGNMKLAHTIYRQIDSSLYSKEILPAIIFNYPSAEKVEMMEDGQLKTDAEILRNIRAQIAVIIYRDVKRKLPLDIEEKNVILFITYWLTYHWPVIMNHLMGKFMSIMNSPIIGRFL